MGTIEIITQSEYLRFFLIIVGSVVFANVFNFILRRYVKRFTEKTKSDVDDILLGIITKPVYVFTVSLGLYFALGTLSALAPYGAWMNMMFFVFFVLLISMLVSRILNVLVIRWIKVQKKFEKTPRLLNKIINVVIYLLAILMILDHFQVEISPLIATLGLGGLAIGLALQNTLSNFFAGLHVISDRPVSVGDFIELPDANISGYVEDIGWRSTRIRTLPNTIVIIPNSKLADSVIVNNSLPEPETAAPVQCGVAYGSDLRKVEEVTVDVARKIQKTVPGAVKNFEPFIRYNSFGDSNINFTVILRVETFVDRYLVTHEFIKALKERYDREGIEISWPVRKVYYAK